MTFQGVQGGIAIDIIAAARNVLRPSVRPSN